MIEHIHKPVRTVCLEHSDRRLRALGVCLVLASLPCCAEAGTDHALQPGFGALDASSAPIVPETGNPADAAFGGLPSGPASRPEGGHPGPSAADAGSAGPSSSSDVRRDGGGSTGGAGLDDFVDGLFGGDDAGAAGFTPPGAVGGWTLDDGSFVDCPAEPPPLPIIGGPCLGVYFSCDWTHEDGTAYTCVCDWVHWLCI